ncbi:MAG TPA: hypothetical protein VGL53_17940 [Bryobacteraceae bacterium]
MLTSSWKPWAVAVSHKGRPAGVLYCKERLIGGTGTGIVFGDDALGMMLCAAPEEASAVISCAFEALAAKMRAIRFVLRPEHALAFEQAQIGGADVVIRSTTSNAHLDLPATYEELLNKVGSRTRRNLRYYRRKSESAENEFTPQLSLDEFQSAAHHLRPNAAFTQSAARLEKYHAMIEAMPTRLLSGLKDRTGAWISLVGGWGIGQRAFVLLQMNDRGHARDSISVVMRAYLLELRIQQGYREVVFLGGTVPPLSSYCRHPECSLVFVDRPSLGWRIARVAMSALASVAPRALASQLAYVVPGHAAPGIREAAAAHANADEAKSFDEHFGFTPSPRDS